MIVWLVIGALFVINGAWTTACCATVVHRLRESVPTTPPVITVDSIATVMATLSPDELSAVADAVYEKRHAAA
jgi:hypothetical protein